MPKTSSLSAPSSEVVALPRKDIRPGARATAAERRSKVLEYRKAGLTFRAIEERLKRDGYDVSSTQVFKDYKKAMRDIVIATTETKAEMVALETERLEMATLALTPLVTKGNVKATSEYRKLSESRRKLHGLDKPVKLDIESAVSDRIDLSKLTDDEVELFLSLAEKAAVSDEEDDEDELEEEGDE